MIKKNNIHVYDVSWLNHCDGGIINNFFEPESLQELKELCMSFNVNHEDFDLIGHTSNIYFLPSFSSKNMVTTRKLKKYEVRDSEIYCECGVSVSKLARDMVDEGVQGFEGLVDLPGTIGAAVYGNAGCFGCSITSLLLSVDLLLPNGEVKTLSPKELSFSKRSSVLKRKELSGVILSVRLHKRCADKVMLQKKAEEYRNIRKKTQPGPKDNLGSIFSNRGKPRLRFKIAVLLANFLSFICMFWLGDKENKKLCKKTVLFTLLGAKHLEPYVYGWNRFIWRDCESHDIFWDFVRYHKKFFTSSEFEIEIKGDYLI